MPVSYLLTMQADDVAEEGDVHTRPDHVKSDIDIYLQALYKEDFSSSNPYAMMLHESVVFNFMPWFSTDIVVPVPVFSNASKRLPLPEIAKGESRFLFHYISEFFLLFSQIRAGASGIL